MTDLQRLLNMAVRWDAAQCLKAREIIDGRLRELETCDICHGEVGHRINCPEGIAFSKYAPPIERREGLELQAGLEEAVRRETARLDADQQLSTS